MIVPISFLLILIIAVFVLIRAFGLSAAHAFVCVTLGYYLASSRLASPFQRVIDPILGLVTSIHL
ncbi:hypothetical protein [Frankia sp. R82]|uniref:hypothetical protein n=1 Tax=Frankia sp. R82 TaxID=2950553 RepID=UPI0020445031|nr:hypothetical protein [Frankia sp. R82]MCM3882148.1 hypothetical protein [Frankia sp. R82]